MAENYPRTKLRRDKSSVDEPQSTPKGGHTTPFSGNSAEKRAGSAVPAAAWWNTQPLPAVESLWAFTLKSALPYLENQHWDLVSDLPHLSAVRPTAMKVDKPQWCDLNSEVAVFPESSAHSPRISSSPHSLSFSPYQQDLSEQMKPVPHPLDKLLFSPSWQSPNCKTVSPQHSGKRQQLSLRRQDETASSAGPSNAGGEEGTAGGELEEETGPVSRQLFVNRVKMSDSQVSLQKEGENKEAVMEEEDEEEEEVQRSVEVGIGRLQSCPMCLQLFPAGFTQMDCDGHLAQCLSEMNVDMTW
ncbi:uncharacterized protein si:ch73-70k4.1 [Amphiprion ocellaris]|uniref:uncharacterized protein si:ch73-70k4.1 n=1 Tax=Amphiprion ocellaris TaxID=80972 RepID=UPI000C313D15|nr:uncharacterized protein si:ch73-70k4.1 [Amphiprion ocellaris]